MFTFHSNDRLYDNYTIINNETGEKRDDISDKFELKIFDRDTFNIIGGRILIGESIIKDSDIACVIVLENNRTYGKHNGKFLYQCIPDDFRLPIFLVPFKCKDAFSKRIENRYVVIRFRDWDNKHPFGTITQNIGKVSDLSAFYEYQLYSQSLKTSIRTFKNDTHFALGKYKNRDLIKLITSKYTIEDRLNRNIISIDPSNSKDFDDAVGVVDHADGVILTIYIANVSIWIDFLDLWDLFSDRVATIYLPDRKLPMLPTILSDDLCSLKEGEKRLAFALDIHIDLKTEKIIKSRIKSTVIKVTNNFRYDTSEQENSPMYKEVKCITKMLNKGSKYVEEAESSHDVVACLMIIMNNLCADMLYKATDGIFRTAKQITSDENADIKQPEIKRFLDGLGGGANYCKWNESVSHDILHLDRYTHITSPIRRLVDLLNITKLQSIENITEFSEKAMKFYDTWSTDNNMALINDEMGAIRKVQNNCALLHMCMTDSKILKDIHDGFIFDKTLLTGGLFKYQVYLNKIKIVKNLITSENIDINVFGKFRIYMFTEEDTVYRKLRISILQ